MKPNKRQGIGRMIGVVDRFKPIQCIFDVIQSDLDGEICPLLKIFFLAKRRIKSEKTKAGRDKFDQTNYFIKYRKLYDLPCQIAGAIFFKIWYK
jgi:hypothetical protein